MKKLQIFNVNCFKDFRFFKEFEKTQKIKSMKIKD